MGICLESKDNYEDKMQLLQADPDRDNGMALFLNMLSRN